MSKVEFQAQVENGIIVVPEEFKQELAEVSTVRIVVFKQPKKQTIQFDIMDELGQKPVSVPGIRSIKDSLIGGKGKGERGKGRNYWERIEAPPNN